LEEVFREVENMQEKFESGFAKEEMEISVFRNMSYTTGLMEINIYGNSGNKSRKDK
jgi:hypothetical protein